MEKHSENELSPFDILGIEPTSDKYTISGAYKRMVLLVHPDKAKSNGLGWTDEQCQEAFQKIRKAYKTIIKSYNFKDMPDYNLEYTNDNEDKLDNTNFKTCKSVKHFNIMYESNKKKEELDGFGDPLDKGYNDFNRPSDSKEVEALLTKDYDINKVNKNRRRKPNKIVKFNPTSLPTNNNCYELGLTNIEDFSFGNNGSKNSLGGSDLSHVHSDHETWGESVSNNTILFNKYNKTTDINKEMKNRIAERDRLDEAIDSEYLKAKELENLEKEREAKLYSKKLRKQRKRDHYNNIQFIHNK